MEQMNELHRRVQTDAEKQRWDNFDERMRAAEKRILATANLVHAGIPMLDDTQTRLSALMDSDARLYGRFEQLAEAQAKNDAQIAALIESQKRTEQSLQAFIETM